MSLISLLKKKSIYILSRKFPFYVLFQPLSFTLENDFPVCHFFLCMLFSERSLISICIYTHLSYLAYGFLYSKKYLLCLLRTQERGLLRSHYQYLFLSTSIFEVSSPEDNVENQVQGQSTNNRLKPLRRSFIYAFIHS